LLTIGKRYLIALSVPSDVIEVDDMVAELNYAQYRGYCLGPVTLVRGRDLEMQSYNSHGN
jgi:hypothetical protein